MKSLLIRGGQESSNGDEPSDKNDFQNERDQGKEQSGHHVRDSDRCLFYQFNGDFNARSEKNVVLPGFLQKIL